MSMLSKVTRGVVQEPERVVMYGVEGVGKTSWSAGAPSPIFLATEDGTSKLDVERVSIASWAELLQTVDELASTEHAYKSLVIDTLDHAEPMCWAHVCERNKWKTIDAPDFQKGYSAAVDEWRVLVARLAAARAKRGMHIILLGHSGVKTHKNPEGGDYQRFEPKLHKLAAGLLKEWSDHVLFARHESFAAKSEANGDKRVRGVSSGRRIIHSKWNAAYDAKTRAPLPDPLELSWDAFWKALPVSDAITPEQREEFDALTSQVPPEVAAKAHYWLKHKCTGAQQFGQALERLRAQVENAVNEQQQKAVA